MFITAVALAMDAFAVATSCGTCIVNFNIGHGLRFGTFFGFFQFLMPVIGYYLAFSFADHIKAFDHWIAFILLGILGIRMFMETFEKDDEEKPCCEETNDKIVGFKNMIVMSIATSIDAMVIGVSFAFLHINIWKPAIIIGIVSFALSTAGAVIGNKIGDVLQKSAQRAGGVVLIILGIKILLEHLSV